MRVLLVGGGTGGHIKPLLPLAAEIKLRNRQNKVFAVTDKATRFGNILQECPDINEVYRISAGKLRRYPNQSFIQRFLDAKTHVLNVRDAGRTIRGLNEAYRLLKRLQPDVIFIKGGYVAVPIGIAARRLGVPFVVHDSDAVPSLVTKIIGRWAEKRLVGIQSASYKSANVLHVGVPVPKTLKPITAVQQKSYKKKLGLPEDKRVLIVTGGSQGSHTVNDIVDRNRSAFEHMGLFVVHITGDSRKAQKTAAYESVSFATNFHDYIRAADLVVTRAGSVMAEFAALKKPIIVIPAGHLAGGHQELNAKIVDQANAAIVLPESKLKQQPFALSQAVESLLKDQKRCNEVASNLQSVFPSGADKKIINLLEQFAKKERSV